MAVPYISRKLLFVFYGSVTCTGSLFHKFTEDKGPLPTPSFQRNTNTFPAPPQPTVSTLKPVPKISFASSWNAEEVLGINENHLNVDTLI